MTTPRAEVLPLMERRRRWSREEKEQIVAASFERGATASEVARRAGIHESAVPLRKELCEQADVAEERLVPVEIVSPMVVEAAAGREPRPSLRQRRRAGLIEIELGDGRRLRVDREVDAEALRRVLDVLDRR